MSNLKLSESLIKIRKENNLSQHEMAEQLGITRFMVSSYESGIREPKIETLLLISDIYKISVDKLLKGY